MASAEMIQSVWHDHPLAAALRTAVDGSYPPVDGMVEIVPPDDNGTTAVVEFTGHAFILTRRDPGDALFVGCDGFGGAHHSDVLLGLAGPDGIDASIDVVLVRRSSPPPGSIALEVTDRYDDHPRVIRARRYRRNVTVLGDERGLVCFGNGLVGRVEVAIVAVEPGTGHELLASALVAVDDTVPVFAQVAPGNAASLRLFLTAGFTPIGSELIIDAIG